jgi:hydrogenase small subunit
MLVPQPIPWTDGETLGDHLRSRGVSRREFLQFCGALAAVYGLERLAAPRIARALEALKRPSVVWIQLQECTGCVESVLRTAEPTIGNLLLDLVSLDYSHTLMAASGDAAERALQDSMRTNAGKYLLVVTGSVPLEANGIYTTIGGRTAKEILEEAAHGAAAVIAIGACAHWGSVQAARPNPTGAVGVSRVVKDKPVVNIAGCPPIGDVVTATIIHYLTFNRLPELDGEGRPLFAYGARIHDQCPRRANFDAGQFVSEFDDEAARKGWCLYRVGCKGPATFSPCPIFQWNTRTSWPIGAGHPCIGCTEPNFWDTMSPFYERLPDVGGFGVESRVDIFGAALAIGAAAGVGAHALATGVHRVRQRRAGRELRVLGASPTGPDGPGGGGGEAGHG